MPLQRPLPRIASIEAPAVTVLPGAALAVEQTCRGCLDACCGKVHAAQQGCSSNSGRWYGRCSEANSIRGTQTTCRRPWLRFIRPRIPGVEYQRWLPPEYEISGTKPIRPYPGQVIVIERTGNTKKEQEVQHD